MTMARDRFRPFLTEQGLAANVEALRDDRTLGWAQGVVFAMLGGTACARLALADPWAWLQDDGGCVGHPYARTVIREAVKVLAAAYEDREMDRSRAAGEARLLEQRHPNLGVF
jgi:hypothetical protein